jgi:hypothetical protein
MKDQLLDNPAYNALISGKANLIPGSEKKVYFDISGFFGKF